MSVFCVRVSSFHGCSIYMYSVQAGYAGTLEIPKATAVILQPAEL